MKLFLLAILLISNIAKADVYKCTINNKTLYRDHPCPEASQSTLVEIDRAHLSKHSLEGCYSVTFAGYESGSRIEKYNIINKGNGLYVMRSMDNVPSGPDLPMRNATQEELRKISQAFHVNAESGVNIGATSNKTDKKPPLGFYRVTDTEGNKVILAYFFITNGIATEMPCP